MFNLRGEEFYGSGIIQNTVPQNLDSVNVLKHERNVTKEPIRVDGKEKVNKIRGDNYYKDYMKEPLNKQNYGKRDDVHFDEAVNYLEPAENQNLDFDGDGFVNCNDYSVSDPTIWEICQIEEICNEEESEITDLETENEREETPRRTSNNMQS